MVQQVLGWLAVHWFALLQTVIIVTGLVVVAIQQREAIRQRKRSAIQQEIDSLAKVLDINRQLITLGFSHPKLFAALKDDKKEVTEEGEYYLQLWLNQFSLIHTYLKHSVFKGEQAENLERDIRDFMFKKTMHHHWHEVGQYYPVSFQKYVNSFFKKNEPPAAAHVDMY